MTYKFVFTSLEGYIQIIFNEMIFLTWVFDHQDEYYTLLWWPLLHPVNNKSKIISPLNYVKPQKLVLN